LTEIQAANALLDRASDCLGEATSFGEDPKMWEAINAIAEAVRLVAKRLEAGAPEPCCYGMQVAGNQHSADCSATADR
jgi:hypothetical protein